MERAAELFADRGIAATSVDEVLAAAGAGKGQFYHYFRGRDELAAAAVGYRCAQVVAGLTEALGSVSSLAGLEQALAALIAGFEQMGLPGCPIGTLAAEVAGRIEDARLQAAAGFDAWERLLADALERMRQHGELRAGTEPAALATGLLASIEGGMVLSQARKDIASLRIAVEAGLGQVRAVRAENLSTSCDQAIFVDQATDATLFPDAVLVEAGRFGQRFQRRCAARGAVRPVLVVVGLVLAQDPPQMGRVPDEGTVQELAAASPDPAFDYRVHAGRPHVAQYGPDPGVGEDRAERGGEVRTPIADHELDLVRLPAEAHQQVAGLLGGPFPRRVQGDAEDADAPGRVLDHGQDVGLAAAGQVDVEEVTCQDRLGLRTQEL